MNFAKELIRPIAEGFSRRQWIGVSVVLGFYLSFVSTLLLAALIGCVGIKVPAYFVIPTTLAGYFAAGFVLGRLSLEDIQVEIPLGILICALVFMMGPSGLKGEGILRFLASYFLIPAAAVVVCYLGVMVARRQAQKKGAIA